MKRKIVLVLCALLSATTQAATSSAAPSQSTLRFQSPAAEWIEGLPVGNGRIGLMAYGLPGKEAFCFNADTLFRRNRTKRIRSADLIPQMRKLVLEGKGVEADKLFTERIKSLPNRCNAYQPFMEITTASSLIGGDGSRTLDMASGIAYLGAWTIFASNPDQMIVMKRTLQKKESLTLNLTRVADEDCIYTALWRGNKGFFTGTFVEGVTFSAEIAVLTDGKLKEDGSVLTVTEANALELRVALRTSPETKVDSPKDVLARVATHSFEELKKRHSKDFSSLFGRMSLSLGSDSRTTEELYNNALATGKASPAFFAQLFAYARYLMISSSRPKTLPPNLQGLWNNSIKPSWESGYTTDMNVQMAYWMAEAANLGDCHLALFDFLEERLPVMHQLAEDIFGAKEAAYLPQYTDCFLTPTCTAWGNFGTFQVIWSGAAAWLASHFYQHWRYSGDDNFGKNRAFPFMKQAMNLYFTLLTKNENGKWILAPSASPEQWTKEDGRVVHTATMDISLVHELTQNLLEMNAVFGFNDPLAARWKDYNENMIDYPLDENGMLREWCDVRDVQDPSHRHLSHIYGLYPSHLFDGDEKLRRAALKAVEKRTEKGLFNSATWSFAWYSCLYARLGQGEKVSEFMNHIVKGGLLPNLLTVHNDWRPGSVYSHMMPKKIFQIDALFGFGAAVCEALAHEENGKLLLLPGVPDEWKKEGSVKGLRLPGNREISFSWKDGIIRDVQVR